MFGTVIGVVAPLEKQESDSCDAVETTMSLLTVRRTVWGKECGPLLGGFASVQEGRRWLLP